MHSPKLNGLLLITNLVLGAGLFYLVTNWPAAKSPAPTARALTEPATSPAAAEPSVMVVTNQMAWAQLESEDYPTYIARLRSIGCPEQTIRDLIIADLDKLLAPKVKSIYGRKGDLHYWDSEEEELANERDHREWERQERAIEREKRKIIQELVGVDLVRERMKLRGYEDYYERRLQFLPEEKRDSVRQILDKFDEQEQALREKETELGEGLGPEDKASLARLQQQRQEELNGVLSPAELEQYELWMSPSANAVRQSMYGMNATEEEFRSVYRLQREFDTRWDLQTMDLSDDATVLKWQQAREELDQQIRQQLGDQRYADYKRGEDLDFHHLNAAVSRYKLPREKAAEAYEIKRTIQQMSAEVQANVAMTPAQKEEVLREMTQETEFALRQLLGNSAYGFFKQRNPDAWVKK